jgi:hypothetical protein
MDPNPDADPAIFVIDLQDANKSNNLNDFFAHYKKKSQGSRNQGFSYFFCLMIEGSGAASGSIPLANGSGSRRPKNMWIRRIRIRIRIRTTFKHCIKKQANITSYPCGVTVFEEELLYPCCQEVET